MPTRSREGDRAPVNGRLSRYFIYAAVFVQSVSLDGLLSPGGSIDVVNADSSPTTQAAALALFAWSLISAYADRTRLSSVLRGLLPLLPFLVWALISFFWSSFPDLTLRRSLRLAIEATSFVLAAQALRREDNVLRTLFGAFLLVAALDFISLAIPQMSFKDRWGYFSGVHYHKNGAGLFFAIALPVFGVGAFSKVVSGSRLIAFLAFVLSLWMFVLTGAKTAIGVLVVASSLTAATYIILRKGPVVSTLVLLATTAAAASVCLFVFDQGITQSVGLLVGDPTLTGRDVLWAYTLYMFSQSDPLLGVGYGALWQNGDFIRQSLENFGVDYVVNEAHNGYLDVLAQTGYVGLSCLIFFLAVTFLRAGSYLRRKDLSAGRQLTVLYAFFIWYGSLIFGVTESFFFIGGGMLWMVQVLTSTLVMPLRDGRRPTTASTLPAWEAPRSSSHASLRHR